MKRWVLWFFLPFVAILSAEENFVVLDGLKNECLLEMGPRLDERVTPCSSFKIALSLIGFDSGILKDEENPVWHYKEGFDSFLESWKSSKTPSSWIKTSCIWYSKELVRYLEDDFQQYVTALEYGNQDTSGKNAWICSTLTISPKEQVHFIKKMIQGQLPVSSYALEKTKNILFVEELADGWKLYGKTGWTGPIVDEAGWFVGWVEKEEKFIPFAYLIRKNDINLSKRIPRVKELLLTLLLKEGKVL